MVASYVNGNGHKSVTGIPVRQGQLGQCSNSFVHCPICLYFIGISVTAIITKILTSQQILLANKNLILLGKNATSKT